MSTQRKPITSGGPRLLITDRKAAIWLERARVHVEGGRIIYQTADDTLNQSYAIPHVNLAVLFLGTGCSITTDATRLLAQEGTHLATTGTGGSPMHLGSLEAHGSSVYFRDLLPAYMEQSKALAAARVIMNDRIDRVTKIGTRLAKTANPSIRAKLPFNEPCKTFGEHIEISRGLPVLLGHEGGYARDLYKCIAEHNGMKGFHRVPRGAESDKFAMVNALIDHGNYLCYGMAGAALWTLGIPPNMSIIHGKTRSGGLVYDLADSVKDAFVLPLAFGIARRAKSKEDAERLFRAKLIDAFDDQRILLLLIETVRDMIKACEK